MHDDFAYCDNYGPLVIIDANDLDEAVRKGQILLDSAVPPDLKQMANEEMRSVRNTALVCEIGENGDVFTELAPEIFSFVHPSEPECTGEDSQGVHDWESPYELLGGMVERPGYWGGNSGDVRTVTVCSGCGMYKTERGPDYWAGVSLREVPRTLEYDDAVEKSLAWCRG